VKIFLLSVAFAIVCALGAQFVLTGFAQQSSENSYASTTSRPDQPQAGEP
jgi:hypothetical protein